MDARNEETGSTRYAPHVHQSGTRIDGRPLRVAFVAHEGSDGGADLLLYELVCGLEQSALCTTMVVVPRDGYLAAALREAGVSVAIANYRWWCSHHQEETVSFSLTAKRALYHARRLGPAAAIVARSLGEFSPDLVASNTCVISAGALAAARMRVPHVWLAQEIGREDQRLTFFFGYGISMRLLGAGSRIVVAISNAVGRALARYVAPRKIHVLHAPCLTPPGLRVNPRGDGDPLRLVLLGRGNAQKGVEEAIRAVGLVRSHGVDARLRVVGVRDLRDHARWRQLSVDIGVSEAVAVAGRVDDVLLEIDHAHIGLMCSRLEAFGRVSVEFLRRGRPVIGTRSGGTPELVEDGVTGLLYDPGDYRALANRVERLAASNATLTALSEAALKRNVDRYVLSNYLTRLFDLLGQARDTGPAFRRRPRTFADRASRRT
jgi:glycosyltransferase involved in cell wall biosynthesis